MQEQKQINAGELIADESWNGFQPGLNPEHPGELPLVARNTLWEPTQGLQDYLAQNSTPLDLFHLALPEQTLQEIVEWSNDYAKALHDSPAPSWCHGKSPLYRRSSPPTEFPRAKQPPPAGTNATSQMVLHLISTLPKGTRWQLTTTSILLNSLARSMKVVIIYSEQ